MNTDCGGGAVPCKRTGERSVSGGSPERNALEGCATLDCLYVETQQGVPWGRLLGGWRRQAPSLDVLLQKLNRGLELGKSMARWAVWEHMMKPSYVRDLKRIDRRSYR